VDVVKEFDGDCLAGILYGVWGGFSGNPPAEDEISRSADCMREVAEYAGSIDIDLAMSRVPGSSAIFLPRWMTV